MGTTLNKDAYKKLIKEDMEKVEKYFPEHSLEKKHIQEVLRFSIECYYPSDGETLNKPRVLPISGVSNSVCIHGFEAQSHYCIDCEHEDSCVVGVNTSKVCLACKEETIWCWDDKNKVNRCARCNAIKKQTDY